MEFDADEFAAAESVANTENNRSVDLDWHSGHSTAARSIFELGNNSENSVLHLVHLNS